MSKIYEALKRNEAAAGATPPHQGVAAPDGTDRSQSKSGADPVATASVGPASADSWTVGSEPVLSAESPTTGMSAPIEPVACDMPPGDVTRSLREHPVSVPEPAAHGTRPGAVSRSPSAQSSGPLVPARNAAAEPVAFASRAREFEPHGQDVTLELQRLAWALFRRKWEVVLTASLVVIPVAIATYRAERLYRSVAQVQVDPEPLQVLPYPDIDQPGTRPHFEMFMRTQEQVLRGAALRGRVAERLRTDPDSAIQGEIGRLGGAFSVQRLENTQIYRLGYVATHPETASRMANIHAEEYIKLNFENRQQMRVKAKELLERELEKLEERVQSSDRELVAYAHRYNIPTADSGLTATQLKITNLSGQLSDAEAEVIVQQSKLANVQSASVGNFPDILATPMIQAARGKVAQLEQELGVLRSTFGENWPTVVQKRAEIKLAQEQLEREKASALSHAQEQARNGYELAEEKRRRLASSVAEQKKLAQDVETALVQYNIIRREVDTSQKMYEAMLERLKQTSMAAGMEFGGFHLIEVALPNYSPDSPKTRSNLALACLLGLGLGVCIAFVREFWNASIRSVEELEQFTSMAVLGAVPFLSPADAAHALVHRLAPGLEGGAARVARLLRVPHKFGPFQPLLGRRGSESASAEAIRNICASILLSRSGRPPRRILITSALSGEGKTTVARHVSLAFAESGARTLLVECDLRRPTFGATFDIGNDGGLTLYLSGDGSFPVIHPTQNNNLYVVAAGPPAPNPPALLNSERLHAFLDEASASFQFIILDAPPVLPVADARVVAPLTEGVILVIRAGVTPRKAIRRVTALLQDAGTPVLGTVLNGTDPRDTGIADYRYYREYQES